MLSMLHFCSIVLKRSMLGEISEICQNLTATLIHIQRNEQTTPTLELEHMRANSIEYMQVVQGTFGSQRRLMEQLSARSQAVTVHWRKLLEALPPSSSHWNQFAPPPLKRCSLGGCLCYLHKPFHRLRYCTGCYNVVYCSRRCQKRYVSTDLDSVSSR